MPRSALILSCAIHGSLLALVGWSSLLWMPRPDPGRTEMSVSLSPGESALVSEEFPTPPAPETATAPVEKGFTPPAPTIEPIPVPMPPAESSPTMISTMTETPLKVSSLPPGKKEHAGKASISTARRSGAGSGIPAAMSAGGGGRGGNYLPPHFLLRYKPPYPPEARAQRIEGVVMLLVGVDAEGHVTSASVREGSGHPMLDRAALEAVRTWRFSPATQNGRPISATVEIPIRFNFST